MSVRFKSRLNPWYLSIPSNPNLYSNQNYYENAMANNWKHCFITHHQPHCHPVPRAYDCVAVYIAGRRTNLVVKWLAAEAANQKVWLVWVYFHVHLISVVGQCSVTHRNQTCNRPCFEYLTKTKFHPFDKSINSRFDINCFDKLSSRTAACDCI